MNHGQENSGNFTNESRFSRFESHGKSYVQCRIRGNFV